MNKLLMYNVAYNNQNSWQYINGINRKNLKYGTADNITEYDDGNLVKNKTSKYLY